MWDKKHILIGITGGIAAYKVTELISLLKKAGATCEVIMTEGAKEFITPLTIQTLTEHKVHIDQFSLPITMDVEHIELAKRADALVICPATANTIAKLNHGLADNLLSTVALAYEGPKLVVPAMNTAMWKNAATIKNVNGIKELGYTVMNPDSGLLACGDIGEGKMPQPADVFEAIEDLLTEKDLVGKTVVVTAGPTMEPLDPVRYLTNHSSGKMGYSIAKEAKQRGAKVVLIKGYTPNIPPNVDKLVEIKTTGELLEAVDEHFEDCDVLIMPAAPLDYRPSTVSDKKIKKGDNDTLSMVFVPNPDVAKTMGAKKTHQIMVGFAAETNDVLENAQGKLVKKNLDFIVANDLTREGAGFKESTNIITIISADGEQTKFPIMSKEQVAQEIINKIIQLIGKARS
ncbi:MAG: bifunctional phosphopantothenoylcysteine decarboxylase/phosphopantothenate--cysteine ligase CoaBC [Tissierellia bacterium]|nr:bifunctional phosphopantothenoylcysteine decarboxylase/phosphopantothenate--cysteine ligase CoaBC [Tissierellia bacterium]